MHSLEVTDLINLLKQFEGKGNKVTIIDNGLVVKTTYCIPTPD
jgi:hypothetical protein